MQKSVPPGLVNLAVQTIRAGILGAEAFLGETDFNREKVAKYLKVIEDAANALAEATEESPEAGEGSGS